MAQFFTQNLTLPSVPTPAFPIIVKVGFQPALIRIIDFTQLKSPTNSHGIMAEWWQGMDSPGAMLTAYTASQPAIARTYITTGGITLLNSLGSEVGQYGATVSGFTNAASGVLTVDSTYNANITAGCVIRVANLADDQSAATLNGVYYVASVTGTGITLGAAPSGFVFNNANGSVIKSPNTSALAVYVSGGSVTVLQTATATLPNPPYNINSNVPAWYNESVQGFSIGSSCFASGSASDNFLIQAWDNMVQF